MIRKRAARSWHSAFANVSVIGRPIAEKLPLSKQRVGGCGEENEPKIERKQRKKKKKKKEKDGFCAPSEQRRAKMRLRELYNGGRRGGRVALTYSLGEKTTSKGRGWGAQRKHST